jgi:competence protein ComEA
LSNFKQHIKQLLGFSAREQLAIIIIILLMIVVFTINFFPGLYVTRQQWDFADFDSLVKEFYERANLIDEKPPQTTTFNIADPDASALEQKFNLFPFNPNMMPEEDWRRLGMADHQIRMIKNYERSGGRFLRKEDLKKIYSVSEAEYKILEPYIIIPAVDQPITTMATDPKVDAFQPESIREIPIIGINSADVDEWMQLPQIGQWFAQRFIQYRNSLGGFTSIDQLIEVQRMDSSRLMAFLPYVFLDSAQLVQVQINRDEFGVLIGHPYISFELTKQIVNHRERRGMINSWDELMQLPGADTLLHDRLKPYLSYD